MNRRNIDITQCNVFEIDPIEGNGEKTLQTFFKKYGTYLRMYGSAKELAENLQTFKDFPQNNCILQFLHGSPYNNTLNIYQGTDGMKYLCKQDIFLYLQNRLLMKDSRLREMMPFTMLILFMNLHEKKLKNCCEFISFDSDSFSKIDEELDKMLSNLDSVPQSCSPLSFKKYSWKDIFDQFEKLLPCPLTDADWGTLTSVVRLLFEDVPTKKIKDDWNSFYNISATVIDGLQKIITRNSQIFLPMNADTDKSTPVVRLFEDGPQKFMIRFELEKAMMSINLRVRETPVYDENRIECMDLDDANKMCASYGIKIEKVPFVKVAIRRAKHSAVPILTPYKYHCKLVVDVLFEFLRDVFFEHKVFHSESKDTVMLTRIVNNIHTFFDSTLKYRFFLSSGMADYLGPEFEQRLFSKKPCNNVRSVGAVGFTVENLKNEMKYLELDAFFPEIMNHADIAYEEVMKNKKEQVLRTCDLFDAIEHCLLLCFFNRFQNMSDFLHIQQGCHRVVGYKCQKCKKEKRLEKQKKVNAIYKILEDHISKCEAEKKKTELSKTQKTTTSKKEEDKENATKSQKQDSVLLVPKTKAAQKNAEEKQPLGDVSVLTKALSSMELTNQNQ